MKKFAKIIIWLCLVAWFMLMMGFTSSRSEEVLCNRIDIVLDDTLHRGFLTVSDIRAMAESSGISMQGYPMSGINTRELERKIEENAFIRNAEVSKDITGRIEISVELRRALVRIMPRGKDGYYLDTEGETIPLSGRFTPHILLVSGFIDKEGNEQGSPGELEEIFALSAFLTGDEFWNNQIEQVYVDRNGEYELIPRVGAHQILLGSLDQWEKKMENLALLYEQGLSQYGWNTYGTINLKYTNQIICTKR